MNESLAGERSIDLQRRRMLAAGLGLTLGACASTPAPAPVVPLNLIITVQARPEINPDIRGRASPLSLRFFELRSAAAFQSADFFSLYDRDQATLGADLLWRDEMIIKPGDTQSITRKANAETRYFGVIAAFRDLERSIWRAGVAVTDGGRGTGANSRDQRITVVCDRTSIRVE